MDDEQRFQPPVGNDDENEEDNFKEAFEQASNHLKSGKVFQHLNKIQSS